VTTDEKAENARTAIGILTAWTSEPGGGDFTRDQVLDLIREGGDEAIVGLIAGMITISGHLLIKLSDATGRSNLDILQELAARYQS
jgi:hypothetical protein